MKIIIFSILFTVQAQYIDEELIFNEQSTVANDVSVITRTRNENERTTFFETSNDPFSSRTDSDAINFSTIASDIISSDGTDAGQTWPTAGTRDPWSFSSFLSTNDLDFITSSETTRITVEEQWFNVNQSHRRDPSASVLFWRPIGEPSWNGATYTLTSAPRCFRQMCAVALKYNGTLSASVSGCLSFILRIRGQPVGQLWIVEDQEQDNMSQKIQLTNKTLRIEHTLRSKMRNLSIETRILFRNAQTDALHLSNLNVNWKGPCRKHRPVPTPSPDAVARRSTFEDDLMTLSSEGSGAINTLTTSEELQSSEQSFMYESTTVAFHGATKAKRPFSVTNQKNVGWFLSLVTLFCVFLVLAAVGHGLWFLRRYHHFSWHVAFDSPIQLLARRSIRSSTRSEKKIATISQIAYDILQSESQREQSCTPSTNSSRSTPISYYTYL